MLPDNTIRVTPEETGEQRPHSSVATNKTKPTVDAWAVGSPQMSPINDGLDLDMADMADYMLPSCPSLTALPIHNVYTGVIDQQSMDYTMHYEETNQLPAPQFPQQSYPLHSNYAPNGAEWLSTIDNQWITDHVPWYLIQSQLPTNYHAVAGFASVTQPPPQDGIGSSHDGQSMLMPWEMNMTQTPESEKDMARELLPATFAFATQSEQPSPEQDNSALDQCNTYPEKPHDAAVALVVNLEELHETGDLLHTADDQTQQVNTAKEGLCLLECKLRERTNQQMGLIRDSFN